MSTTFDRFCLDHYDAIRRGLAWTLGGPELGGEATDEAFARAYERWPQVGVMANPAGWVYRVGLNWGRRRQWRRGREIELLSRTRPKTHYEASFSDPDLAAAVAELPFKLRSVVVLRMILDRSEADTAADLGIAPGTVKSRLHRGLAALRAELEATDDPTTEQPGRSRQEDAR